jgi:hypothetical protein
MGEYEGGALFQSSEGGDQEDPWDLFIQIHIPMRPPPPPSPPDLLEEETE